VTPFDHVWFIIDLIRVKNYTIGSVVFDLKPIKGEPMKPKLKVALGSPVQQVIQPGYAHFAMVEKQALANLDELMREDMNAARLIVSLIRLMEPGSGGVVVISRKAIQELLGVSESTAKRALRTLIDGHWVHRIRIGGAYALAVNSSIAWVGSRDKMHHAIFKATVVAAASEQDDHGINPGKLKQLPTSQPSEMALPVGEAEPPSQELIPGTEGVDMPNPFAKITAEEAEAERARIFQKGLEARGQRRLTD
jgi:hypothetical protein